MRGALVFGGTGQIGVPVIERLLMDEWRVWAVTRTAQENRGHLAWLRGDLHRVDGVPAQLDAIFSLGPLDLFSHWYARTQPTASRVVAFGSTSLDTKQASVDMRERELADRLADAEARIFTTARELGANATVLRPTLVYGAARDQSLTRIAGMARRLGFFVLPRDATGLRQPVHVDDLADAALAVVDAQATHGHGYALPGGETLAYVRMVERTLASLHPPRRLVRLPAPLFRAALAAARRFGGMRDLNNAVVARMGEDLVFDVAPARRDFGYAPRAFRPEAAMFG